MGGGVMGAPATHPARVLVDARTMPVTITTLPDRLPAPVRPTLPIGRRTQLEPRRARPVTVPAVRSGSRPVVRAAVAIAALAVVAAAGLLAGHARLGLSLVAALGRVALGVVVVAGLAALLAGAARVHCPGCRGVRR
jgi:hypothetical protein